MLLMSVAYWKELHHMNKLAMMGIVVLGLGAAAAPAFELAQDATNLTFSAGGRPVLVYRHAGYPFKPYAAQLYTPAGVGVLRDSPSDHQHHHALMFALAADGVNFWEEVAPCGSQAGRGLAPRADGLTQQLDWLSAGSNLLLRETRTLQLQDVHGVTLLTWRTKLETLPGKDEVKLTGGHYYGLGMRFLVSMDQGGAFTNSSGQAGEVVRGSERLTAAKWTAYTAAADGHPVTVALFDHPANLRHPNRMFTMSKPFAYLADTLNLWKEPYLLKAGQPLNLCYGVAAWDGRVAPAAIEQVYQQWLAACGVPAP